VAAPWHYRQASWARFWWPATVALDLGTDAFRLGSVGTRALLEVPARAVVDARGQVVALGKRALCMEERLPEDWRVVLPVEMGHLSHPQAARQLLRVLLAQLQRRRLWKPRLWLAAPEGVTPMERSVLAAFLRELPVREYRFADGAVAQCLGAGWDPAGVPGLMVVDIGAQRTSTTVLSFGRPVLREHHAAGGQHWTAALHGAVEDAYRVRVPRNAAEEWKRTGGDGRLPAQDRLTGRLRTLELPAAFAAQAMEGITRQLLEHLSAVCTRCPPALRVDVQERGVLLVGNGGRIPGLAERLERELGMPVHLPQEPGRCLVRGLARLAQAAELRPAVAAAADGTVDLFPLEA
jgi:rod shape-determining protein MreB